MMWIFKRTKPPPPSPDRALEVAQVQEEILSIAPGLRHELDALEATLIRQRRSGALPTENRSQR